MLDTKSEKTFKIKNENTGLLSTLTRPLSLIICVHYGPRPEAVQTLELDIVYFELEGVF